MCTLIVAINKGRSGFIWLYSLFGYTGHFEISMQYLHAEIRVFVISFLSLHRILDMKYTTSLSILSILGT